MPKMPEHSKFFKSPVSTPGQPLWKTGLSYLLQVSLLAIIYYEVMSFGLFLEGGQRGAMPIPLPAGVALAALLLFGIRLWPGIAIGLLAFNKIEMDIPFEFNSFHAAGAALQAMIGTWLLQKFQLQVSLARVRDVLLFAIVAILISPLLGASVASIALVLSEMVPWDYTVQIWATSWFSDGVGC